MTLGGTVTALFGAGLILFALTALVNLVTGLVEWYANEVKAVARWFVPPPAESDDDEEEVPAL